MRLLHRLMIVLAVVVLALAVWQRNMIGCITFSRAEPVSEEQLAVLETEGFIEGPRQIELAVGDFQNITLPQPTIPNDKVPSLAAERIPGLASALVRCTPDVPVYNESALLAMSYLLVVLVVYALGRFGWWIRTRKRPKNV